MIEAIDAANAADPRHVEIAGARRPHELVYAERMSAALAVLYPNASELLQVAARAQHLRRWEIARGSFPAGRQGYEQWRTTCREHHARLAAEIMSRHGYDADEIALVGRLICKQKLKQDAQSQALENVVAVVFIEHYLAAFLADHSNYDDGKIVDIIAKTLRKMSAPGHQAAMALPLPERHRRLIEAALARQR